MSARAEPLILASGFKFFTSFQALFWVFDAIIFIQAINLLNFFLGQGEIEDFRIGFDVVRISGAGDWHETVFDMPVEDHLNWGYLVFFSQPLQHWGLRLYCPGDRAVGFDPDFPFLAIRYKLFLVQEGVDFHLVDRRHHMGGVDRLLD